MKRRDFLKFLVALPLLGIKTPKEKPTTEDKVEILIPTCWTNVYEVKWIDLEGKKLKRNLCENYDEH